MVAREYVPDVLQQIVTQRRARCEQPVASLRGIAADDRITVDTTFCMACVQLFRLRRGITMSPHL